MINKFFRILKTQTIKDSGITIMGTAISASLGFIFYIILARNLGAVYFGIFSLGITTLTLVSDIGQVGTDTGLIRFVGKYFKREKGKALQFLKLGLKVKIIASIIILFIGWFLAPFFATYIIKKPELTSVFRVSLIGAVGSMLFSFSTNSLLGIQRFFVWGGLNISMNLLRLISALFLISLGLLTLSTGLSIFIIFLFLGFLLGLIFLPSFLKTKNEDEIAKEFFKYNKWVAIFILFSAISSRLDTYIAARFLNLRDVGIYSVATNLASVIPQIVYAIASVVAPKLSEIDNNSKAKVYLKKLQLMVLGLACLGIAVAVPLSYFVIHKFYGSEFSASFTPFLILLLAQAIFLISIPVHTAVMYYFSYPKLFVIISLVDIFTIFIVGPILIRSFGIVGAGATFLTGNVINFLIPAFWVFSKFIKNK